jgi:hypothetical protein
VSAGLAVSCQVSWSVRGSVSRAAMVRGVSSVRLVLSGAQDSDGSGGLAALGMPMRGAGRLTGRGLVGGGTVPMR